MDGEKGGGGGGEEGDMEAGGEGSSKHSIWPTWSRAVAPDSLPPFSVTWACSCIF